MNFARKWTPAKRRFFFNNVGQMLFSDRWKNRMSQELGISLRSVFRYSDGETNIPDDVMDRIYLILKGHIKTLKRHLRELRESK